MRPRAILAALVAALLAGCPSEKSSAPASTGPAPSGPTASAGAVVPDKPAASDDDAPLPGFEDVKKGQRYLWELSDGVTREDEIVSRDDDELVIRSTQKAGADATTSERRQRLRGRPSTSTAKEKAAGSESVTVSGKKLDCDVLEAESGGLVTRRLKAKKFPFVVRVEAPPGNVTLKLIEIREP